MDVAVVAYCLIGRKGPRRYPHCMNAVTGRILKEFLDAIGIFVLVVIYGLCVPVLMASLENRSPTYEHIALVFYSLRSMASAQSTQSIYEHNYGDISDAVALEWLTELDRNSLLIEFKVNPKLAFQAYNGLRTDPLANQALRTSDSHGTKRFIRMKRWCGS